MPSHRDPLGTLLSGLGVVARSDLLDRLGLRRPAERAVRTLSSGGVRVVGRVSRPRSRFTASGRPDVAGGRLPLVPSQGLFDLTPTEDQRLLVEAAADLAASVLRPAAPEADSGCVPPESVLKAGAQLGLGGLGVPVALGGIAEERSAVTGVLVAEALAHGDLGLAVVGLAPGSVATALTLWGSEAQQQTYLPSLIDGEAAAVLALTEPRVLFDALAPATIAEPRGDGHLLTGEKSLVPLGEAAGLFVVGAMLDDSPALFLVEADAPGVSVTPEPGMGVRGAGTVRLRLEGVPVPPDSVLGAGDGSTYRQCLRLSRLAWCGLAVGTAQAVLDHVIPYVNQREAFGAPVSHRQSVAFAVADMAIEVQAMRLVTYRAAARAAAGEDFSREVALARRLCSEHGMRIGSDGVQLLGGHGYVSEHPVERWYRDLRAVAVLEGGVMV